MYKKAQKFAKVGVSLFLVGVQEMLLALVGACWSHLVNFSLTVKRMLTKITISIKANYLAGWVSFKGKWFFLLNKLADLLSLKILEL